MLAMQAWGPPGQAVGLWAMIQSAQAASTEFGDGTEISTGLHYMPKMILTNFKLESEKTGILDLVFWGGIPFMAKTLFITSQYLGEHLGAPVFKVLFSPSMLR